MQKGHFCSAEGRPIYGFPQSPLIPSPSIVSANPLTTWLARSPDADKAVQACQKHPHKNCREKSEPGIPCCEGNDKARNSAGGHQAFHAEVHNPGTFDDDFAQGAEQKRCSGDDGPGKDGYKEIKHGRRASFPDADSVADEEVTHNQECQNHAVKDIYPWRRASAWRFGWRLRRR